MEIPVFVISLKRSVERRDHTTKKLNDLGVSFQIIEAVDGQELSDQEMIINKDFDIYRSGLYSRYLLKEEVGCVLSHLKIYRKMIEDKTELACILEDDNDFTGNFREFLLEDNISTNDWDLLYLGHHNGSFSTGAEAGGKKQLLRFNSWIGEATGVPYGSYAYIINLKAAKKLLDCAFPIRSPFDRYLGNSSAIGIRTFLVSPPCATQNTSFSSTINYDPKIIYATPFWKFIGVFKRKIYHWFPVVRTFRIWIYLKWNHILIYLRKIGIFKNHFVKI